MASSEANPAPTIDNEDNDKSNGAAPPSAPATADKPSLPAHKKTASTGSLRNADGWDGKLRVPKKQAVLVNPEVLDPNHQSDGEDTGSDEEEEDPLVEKIDADEDLLADEKDDTDQIDLVHCRIQSIESLNLNRFTSLQRLCLRQNQISSTEDAFPANLAPTLQDLDLYDNLIKHIRGFEDLTELTSLDLSFNKIKHIKNLETLKKLKDIYFVQNNIKRIEGLEELTRLRNLELGGNKIREIEGLDTLIGLEELWLGKNKIRELKGLNNLTNLTILSIQANRLESIQGLDSLTNLEELHISNNALTSLSGLQHNINLRVIDISSNPIEHLSDLETLVNLEEFWASWCGISDFREVESQLGRKEKLQTVYFEGNPLQKNQPVLYRNKVRLALPQVKQIDATFVRVE